MLFGNIWEDVMQLCIRMHNTWGPGQTYPEDEPIEILWRDFEIRDRVNRVKEQATAVKELTTAGANLEAAAKAAFFDDETAKDMSKFSTIPGGMNGIGPMAPQSLEQDDSE